MESILEYIKDYTALFPEITRTSVLEIVIISILIYEFLQWILNTRAWTLLRGIAVILAFIFFVYILRLDTIMWLLEKGSTIVVIVLVIIFQPELRRALEQLGSQQFLDAWGFSSGKADSRFMSEETCAQIADAVFAMAEVRTGALIVIEQNETLSEYVNTGIVINGRVSSGLLINIFEKNTPLHDGAVIVRGNEILAATCYLPLSESMDISKALGTRHRAALGMSENTDSVTLVVSEETGRVSFALKGKLIEVHSQEGLENMLISRANRQKADSSKDKKKLEIPFIRSWKGSKDS